MKNIKEYIFEKGFHNAYTGDEYYFRMEDIENELSHYVDHFKGKVIYCNCDMPSRSNFYKYFKENFESLGLKLLMSTYYEKPIFTTYDGEIELEEEIESGDFTKNEDILKKCDIVVTSPPYSQSLQEKLIKLCIDNNKDFIFGGSVPLIKNKRVFDLYKNNKIYVGYNRINEYENRKETVGSCWYTSFKTEFPFIELSKEYNAQDYQKYDNYNAINCNRVKSIPVNYGGPIGVPISIVFKLNKEQFEVIDNIRPILNGVPIYQRFIIKNKNPRK